jgi:predicted membrane-bound mannosyltransferase
MLTLLRLAVLWATLHLLVPTRLLASAAQGDSTTWQQHVRAPSSSAVTPKAVLDAYTTGSVTNAQGIVTGASPANLTRPSNTSDAPSVVIDFGQNVVGYLTIKFAGAASLAQGYPGLRLAYSETLEYLTDRSDYTRSDRGETVRH